MPTVNGASTVKIAVLKRTQRICAGQLRIHSLYRYRGGLRGDALRCGGRRGQCPCRSLSPEELTIRRGKCLQRGAEVRAWIPLERKSHGRSRQECGHWKRECM